MSWSRHGSRRSIPSASGSPCVPGVLLGATALVPLLLAGLTARPALRALPPPLRRGRRTARVRHLVRRTRRPFRAGFFSETLTGATCLLAWYGLVRWREERAPRWLVLVSLSLAVAAITRPLTALVFAIPVAVVVLRDAARRRLWRQVRVSALVALPVIALLPLQNVATGGPWWELPYGRYTREYLPFDHMGLGLDDAAPTRARPPDIERLAQAFAAFHADYTASRLPAALVARTRVFFADLAGDWALLAFALAILGVAAGPAALRFAAGSAAALFLAHLAYAHPPQWSIYYAEALPVGAARRGRGRDALLTVAREAHGIDEPARRAALLTTLAALVAIWPLPGAAGGDATQPRGRARAAGRLRGGHGIDSRAGGGVRALRARAPHAPEPDPEPRRLRVGTDLDRRTIAARTTPGSWRSRAAASRTSMTSGGCDSSARMARSWRPWRAHRDARAAPRRRDGHVGWFAVAVAVVVAAPSLLNGFAYDDLPLVVENARVTTLLPPWEYFTQSYWPAGGLYRPLTVWLLALQWKLGGGAPWIFHATNVVLHALVTGLVYLLARRLMAPAWAAAAAVLFAVHPVHVEAVANVVGISELLCSAFVLGAVLLALRGARDGFTRRHPPGRDRAAACSRRSARSRDSSRRRCCWPRPVLPARRRGTALRRVAPVAVALALLLAALLLLRAAVLGGLAGESRPRRSGGSAPRPHAGGPRNGAGLGAAALVARAAELRLLSAGLCGCLGAGRDPPAGAAPARRAAAGSRGPAARRLPRCRSASSGSRSPCCR